MMYSNQFVVSIKCNNNIMRENKDVVYLPFGSEYSILLITRQKDYSLKAVIWMLK